MGAGPTWTFGWVRRSPLPRKKLVLRRVLLYLRRACVQPRFSCLIQMTFWLKIWYSRPDTFCWIKLTPGVPGPHYHWIDEAAGVLCPGVGQHPRVENVQPRQCWGQSLPLGTVGWCLFSMERTEWKESVLTAAGCPDHNNRGTTTQKLFWFVTKILSSQFQAHCFR